MREIQISQMFSIDSNTLVVNQGSLQSNRGISRNYVFTCNNYNVKSVSSEEVISDALKGSISYICFGKEIGESGTRHLQGFIRFRTEKSQKQCREVLKLLDPRPAHVEIMRGTFEQAIEYCKKGGDYFEWGTAPMSQKQKGDASKEIWSDVIDKCKKNDIQGLIDNYPKIYVTCHSQITSIISKSTSCIDDLKEHQVFWLYGQSGSGKSYLPRNLGYPVYNKGINKWWDQFDQSGDVITIIDDVDKKFVVDWQMYLKQWNDLYYFLAETKNGTRRIRPRWIFITSQFTIQECCGGDDKLYAAFSRRCAFHEITPANRDVVRAGIKARIDKSMQAVNPVVVPRDVPLVVSSRLQVPVESIDLSCSEKDLWDEEISNFVDQKEVTELNLSDFVSRRSYSRGPMSNYIRQEEEREREEEQARFVARTGIDRSRDDDEVLSNVSYRSWGRARPFKDSPIRRTNPFIDDECGCDSDESMSFDFQ